MSMMEAEKLCRLLESLSKDTSNTKPAVAPDNTSPAHQTKRPSFIRRRTLSKYPSIREEKIHLCNQIADCLVSAASKNAKEFPEVLSLALDTILACCKDSDANTRLAAEEVLNRILQDHIAAQPVTILVDLFKHVKQNDESRCVKAAWTRFAHFSNYIRPQRFRCRAFVLNLIPCILQLTRREEDLIHESLTEGLPPVLKALGSFITEAEIRSLVRAFLPNLSSDSSVKRRTAASAVVEICQHSKKPEQAIEWLLRGLLALVRASPDNASSASFCGILLAIKNALFAGRDSHEIEDQQAVRTIALSLQIHILQTLLEFCSNNDHNVQGFALETLHTFLRRLDKPMRTTLLQIGGLARFQNSPGDSSDSFEFGQEESSITVSPELKESEPLDPENFGTVHNPMLVGKKSTMDSDTVSIISSAMSEEVLASQQMEDETKFQSSGDEDDSPHLMELAGAFNDGAFTDKDVDTGQCGISLVSGDLLDECSFTRIGSLFDVDRTAGEYIARFISSRFLLKDGTLSEIRPSVRVSVQSVALSCLSDLVNLFPALLFKSRFLDGENSTLPMLFTDACIFLDHTDPLLKAHGAVLSCLLAAATVNPLVTFPSNLTPDVDLSLRKTSHILRQESAAACRLAVEALERCMEVFLFSEDDGVKYALDIIWEGLSLLTDSKISYWLLKVELLRFLRAVPLTHLLYAETVYRSSERQDRIKTGLQDTVLQCLLSYLGHDDHRLRQAAAETLAWMPFSFGLPLLISFQTYTVMRLGYENYLKSSKNEMMHSIQTGLCFPYNAHEMPRFVSGVEDSVALIVGYLFDSLICSTKKDLTTGLISCLCLLSRVYPTSSYARSWFGVIEDTDLSMERYTSPAVGSLARISEIMTSTTLASDLLLHAHSLELLGNLFAGISMAVCNVRGKPDGLAWNHLGCRALRLVADTLSRHLAKLLNIVKAVTEGQKSSDIFNTGKSLTLLSASPGSTLSIRRRNDSVKRSDKKSKVPLLELRSKAQLGALTTIDVYGPVMESVKKAWHRHRTHLTQDSSSPDRFYQLVRSSVVCWAQLLEMTTGDFISPYTDEAMRYLRVTMDIEGQASVYCVEQLLRCLFGCNMAQMDCTAFLKDIRGHFVAPAAMSELLVAFVEESAPGSFLPRFMGSTVKTSALDNDEWSRRWNVLLETQRIECLEGLFKSYSKEKRVAMSDTIRQFEAVVIRSLQLYTCTVECGAQVQVLDLLVLLLQLHVNYNVLDGEHVFLKYILKQLELLEMGHIATSQKLMLYLFRFLIHLSHDKVIFQQNILTYGHIMQYCDSLMAITAPSQKMVLPILRLLFDDAVHRRSTMASVTGPEERDAQMEVILSTALRCLPEANALDIVQKFLMHQLAKSAGFYETHVRDLVEVTFQRILPASMNSSLCIHSFGKDHDKISSFLSIVGCHELIESQSFRRFFADLIVEVRKPSENNLAALLFFSSIIEQFVSRGVIEPLLKLFHIADQNHPLEDPLEKAAEVSAPAFALVISEIFDALFESNTSTSVDAKLQQMLDFVYCSLLKTLTNFVQIVDQGPIKMALREIQSTNRLDHSERQHINTACRVAWLQFRFAATGCDLEPRFWNKGIKLPIEDHICEVLWNFIRPGRSSTQPEESRRLVSDIMREEVSAMELALLDKAHNCNVLELLQSLLSLCRNNQEDAQFRWFLQLYAEPSGLSVLLDLAGELTRLIKLDAGGHGTSPSFFGADDLERVKLAWAQEKPSELKTTLNQILGLQPSSHGRICTPDGNVEVWLQSLAGRVALTSTSDDAAGIARLLCTFDEETVMTVVTDQRFSVALLRDCLRPVGSGVTLGWSRGQQKFSALFHAARFALLQEMKKFANTDWSVGEGVDEWTWLMLTSAFVEFAERCNEVDGQFPLDAMDDILQLVLIGFRSVPRCLHASLVRRRALQCLLLSLENSSFIMWLRVQEDEVISGLITEVHRTLMGPKSCLNSDGIMDVSQEAPGEEANGQISSWLHTEITHLAALLDDPESGFLTELETGIILGLSRLPMVAEIVRIPPSAYALGWTSQRATGHDPIPIELLQELAILKEFVSRVCRYGWTSRRQFEETWMAFLSVLSSVPIEEESETDEAQHEHTVSNRIAAGRVALRCITALLLESVLAPRPGNPLRMRGSPNTVRSPHHHLDDFSASINCRRTLAGCEDQWVRQFLCRPRRASYFHYTHFDGLDQSYCRWIMKGSPQSGSSDSQVDLRSCLKFLMDLYSHWTSDERVKKLSPYILDEVVKSTLHISNIFHDEKNFRWMYVFVRQVLRIKNIEESLFYGHLIDALSKAMSVLDEDKEAISTLKRAVEVRATQSLMNRLSSCRMVLRLIRQQSPGDANKSMQWLYNLSSTLYEAECRSRIRSGDALDLLLTIFVTQIDHFTSKAKEWINPFSEVLLLELRNASTLSFPILNNLVLILGRYLVDKRMEDGVFRGQVVKIGLEVLNLAPPSSLSVLGLLLTCLDPEMRSNVETILTPEDNSPSIADSHSDPLFIMAMEKMAIVQQRRNKSFVVESDLLGNLFLQLLLDKTPLRQAINRVMAEFQSCPATSAPFIADLVAKVFGLLKKQRLDGVVEEWIALSLGNFANRSPPGLGIWSLSCLFCAASSGSLSTLLPFIRLRSNIYDDLLFDIFTQSGLQFFLEIEMEETRKMFVQAVGMAVSTSPAMRHFHQKLCALKHLDDKSLSHHHYQGSMLSESL